MQTSRHLFFVGGNRELPDHLARLGHRVTLGTVKRALRTAADAYIFCATSTLVRQVALVNEVQYDSEMIVCGTAAPQNVPLPRIVVYIIGPTPEAQAQALHNRLLARKFH